MGSINSSINSSHIGEVVYTNFRYLDYKTNHYFSLTALDTSFLTKKTLTMEMEATIWIYECCPKDTTIMVRTRNLSITR